MNTTEFLPFILPDVPGAPDPIVLQAVVMASRKFCVESHAWKEMLDPVALVDGEKDISITHPSGSQVVAVKGVWMPNYQMQPATIEQLQVKLPGWQSAQGSQPLYYNAAADWQAIRVYPTPMNASGAMVTIQVAYAPTLTATTLPDSLAMRYMDGIVSGAKARLASMRGKSWSDAGIAAMHYGLFEESILNAKIDALHEGVQGSLTVKSRRFGR